MLIWPLSRVLVQNVRSTYLSLSYKSFFPFHINTWKFLCRPQCDEKKILVLKQKRILTVRLLVNSCLLTDSIYSIGKVLSCTKSGRAGAVIKALVFASTRLSMPFNIEHWVIRAAPAFTWVKDTKYMKEVTHKQLFKWKKAELYLFCPSLDSWKCVERTLFFVSSAASPQLTWALLRWHTAY